MYNNNFDPEERIDWELLKEQREQKKIGWNALKKPKRSGCRLPSDYLTRKQKNDLNGEVKVMNMNKTIAYKAFKLWPTDIQKQYLEGLVENYHVTLKQIAEMMGVNHVALSSYLRTHDITGIFPHAPSRKNFDAAKWDAFCQNASESLENAPETTKDVSEGSEPVSENAPESLEKPAGETNQKLTPEEIIEHVKSGLIPYEEAAKMIGVNQDLPKGEFVDISEKTHTAVEDLQEEFRKSWMIRVNNALLDGKISTTEATKLLGYSSEKEPEKTQECNLNFLTFNFRAKDIRSWDELFEFVKAVKLPFNNTVEINVQEYYSPFGPGDLPMCKGGCV